MAHHPLLYRLGLYTEGKVGFPKALSLAISGGQSSLEVQTIDPGRDCLGANLALSLVSHMALARLLDFSKLPRPD